VEGGTLRKTNARNSPRREKPAAVAAAHAARLSAGGGWIRRLVIKPGGKVKRKGGACVCRKGSFSERVSYQDSGMAKQRTCPRRFEGDE